MIRDEELRNTLDYSEGQKAAAHRVLVELVICCIIKIPKVADKNGESCISILEKTAGCPTELF